MIDFVGDIEQQYESYCNIAEEYGFLDTRAAKSGFRCTVKSPEFNAGWIGFTGGVAFCREEIYKVNSELNDLKAQLAAVHESRIEFVEYCRKVESDEFVVVPKECPDPEFSDALFKYLRENAFGDDCNEPFVGFSDIDPEKIWILMIEAAGCGDE